MVRLRRPNRTPARTRRNPGARCGAAANGSPRVRRIVRCVARAPACPKSASADRGRSPLSAEAGCRLSSPSDQAFGCVRSYSVAPSTVCAVYVDSTHDAISDEYELPPMLPPKPPLPMK